MADRRGGDELADLFVRDFDETQGQGSDGNTNHRVLVLKEGDGRSVEGEILRGFVEEELDGVRIDTQ